MQTQNTSRKKWRHTESHYKHRFSVFDFAVQELTDLKYKSEGTIRELRSRLGTVEEENSRMKQDLQNLRQSNSSLDGDYHEQEKVSFIWVLDQYIIM